MAAAQDTSSATLVSAGAAGGTTALVLIGVGAALWFLTRDEKPVSNPEAECREAAERWVPKCVIEKKKARARK